MNATDELRRLLDERGVEHTDAEDGHTQHTFWLGGDHEIAACNSGERLAVYNLTPSQAIAATLGRGTCEMIAVDRYCDVDKLTTSWGCVCSACGSFHKFTHGEGWAYCPSCGREVANG